MAEQDRQSGIKVETQVGSSQKPSPWWGSRRKAPRNIPRESELAGNHPPSFWKILGAAWDPNVIQNEDSFSLSSIGTVYGAGLKVIPGPRAREGNTEMGPPS